MKTNQIRVVFRRWKNGDVIALFPDISADNLNRYCESYEHVGQHSGADYKGVIKQTTPATENEYSSLLAELRRIGYDNLKIVKRK